MKKTSLIAHRISACAAVLFFVAAPMRAATLLEIDYQSYNAGTGFVTANSTTAGASDQFLLSGTTGSISPNGTTGIVSGNSDITTGYFTNNRVTGFNTSLGSSNTAGTGNNAEYLDYKGGGNGFGTATVQMLFKPNFTGLNSGISFASTNMLFGTSNSSASKVVRLSFSSGDTASGNVNTKLTLSLGSSSTNATLNSAFIALDTTKWYYLAASWTPGDQYSLYIREVSASSGSMSISANNLTDYTNIMNLPVYVGGNADGLNPMNGSMTYFQWTDAYTDTTAGYDGLFNALVTPVPEPSTLALMAAGLGAAAFLRRRRK